MNAPPVDLRSDTVTQPTPAMRRAMAEAEVGDDVYGEDPTVRRLERKAAELVGHEAAVFVPSGTMGNQIAIHLHTRPGADVLVEERQHVYLYELGAMSALSGAMPRVLHGLAGRITPAAVEAALPPDEYDIARATLLVLENTHNHGGGIVLEPGETAALVRTARARGLAVHLDGARLFNAATACGVRAADLAGEVDSVMFCLSKGLGAPVGSLLCANRERIAAARVVRKRLGGGMRQVGILAAAGLHALEHHVERIADDHARARLLAREVAALPGFVLDPATVRTNIVIAGVEPPGADRTLLAQLAERGVLASSMGAGRVRFVTHLDVDDSGIERAIEALREVAGRAGRRSDAVR